MCPDKEQPYVFAVERQICTSKQLAEAMGQKLLLPDPLRDKLAKDMDERLRTTKPKPLTKQTFREYVKIRDAPQSLPNYIREVDKEETRLGDSILELTVDSPMILGFASNDLLGGSFLCLLGLDLLITLSCRTLSFLPHGAQACSNIHSERP